MERVCLTGRQNNTWNEDKNNEQHGLDMYAIQVRTARDVSFLVDFLPGYLCPHVDRKIDYWGIAGISLGGHSTWLALSEESRLEYQSLDVQNYIGLIEQRAQTSKIPFEVLYIPASLLDLIRTIDPAWKDSSNPFLGKKVLILSGEEDTLVPWTASSDFVNGLEVGKDGLKKVIVQKGVGHKCTKEMVKEAAT
ncbi:hypothetical protein B0H34DRAFT_678769 [Crassisporium funariophilum]|nr:hypothetical protein B0H34DRAFT_678769 [Crassisporium funariophilum]